MHFAAFIEAGESMINPPKFYHNNLMQLGQPDRRCDPGRGEAVRVLLHGRGLLSPATSRSAKDPPWGRSTSTATPS